MKYSILLTGTGGQGVMSAGKLLASVAATLAHATFVPWYGAAQRGGTAKCTVVLSDKPVVSPLPGKCTAVIAMSDSACQRAVAELRDEGTLVRNSNVCKSRIKAGGFYLLDVPADDIAKESGDVRNSSIVLVGALLGSMKAIPKLVIMKAFKSQVESKPGCEALCKALSDGFDWGGDKNHTKFIEATAVVDSAYSIEKTTVGKILDTPKLRALVEEIFPQVLDHPLIEAGRTFKFIDAIPYMRDMITTEQLELFSQKLEEIK